MNRLYYGDNLDVLRRHIADESVDLIYLDPPFNSNASYNVLFAEHDGTRAASQIKAFEDTWVWDESAARAYEEIVEAGGRVAEAMRAFRTFLGQSNMMAYLAMMAPRLVELRRVLKSTGSIYLHCDPTASHYLKMLMDAVFGPEHFLNEVIWKRTSAHSSARRYGPVHDVLLFYGNGPETVWIGGHQSYGDDYIQKRFRKGERPWKDADLTGAGIRHGETGKVWRGLDVTAKGRHWGYPPAELDRLDASGYIYWPEKPGGWPRLKKYLADAKGVPLQDVWTDVFPLNSQAQERLGYPTQKPEALLARVIAASSEEAAVVLDPFCGCGTTIAAAQKLGRRWVGIDITHLAIGLIRHRLRDTHGREIEGTYEVVGEPVSLPDAETLAANDPYQFQWWALGLVGARPVEQRKGGDKGIDGRIYFHDEAGGTTKQVILSVKAGHVTPGHLRDLRGVLDREKAQIGVLLCLDEPTKGLRKEAAAAEFYHSPGWNTKHPRLQILTVAELLEGGRIDMPPLHQASVTFKKAPKARAAGAKNRSLSFESGDDDGPPE